MAEKRLKQAQTNAAKYNQKIIEIPSSYTYEEGVKLLKKLSKQADQRMVRIEAYSHDEHFKGIKTYAYARARHDIERYSGPGAKRWNTKPPENMHELHAKLQDVTTFLNSPTSTKKGIIESYKKRADTLNARYGTNYSWQEWANFFESETFQKLSKIFGSKTMLKVIGKLQKGKKSISDAVEKINNQHIKQEFNSEEERNNAIYALMAKTSKLTIMDLAE